MPKKKVKTVYEELTDDCVKAGISMRAACIEAGLDNTVIQRWNGKDPKSIVTYKKLKGVIDKHLNKNK